MATSFLPKLKLILPAVPGGDRLRHLLHDWRAALFACLPRRARLWLARRRPILLVRPIGDDAAVEVALFDDRLAIGGIDLRTPGPVAGAYGTPKHGWAETRLELPTTTVLVRHLRLPIQVKEKLRQVLSFEMDRLTPFTATDVYFDARVVGLEARGTMLDIELALCRRDAVGDWLERLREGGTPASRLTWVDAWPQANLLPPEERPRPRRFGSAATALLVLAVLSLLAGVLLSPLYQKDHQQTHLERQLRKERIAAAEVQQLRDELDLARRGSVEVLQRMRQQPRMTDLLRELTDILPDGTWVQTLNYNNGQVDIRGESTQATALIGLLEQGPGISDVSFRSPVMQLGSGGQERFHISFNYSRPQTP